MTHKPLAVLALLLMGCASSPNLEAPRAAQASPEAEKKRYCKVLMGQALQQPTRSGSMAEGLQNANTAYAHCMAGLPPPQPSKPVVLKCTEDTISIGDSVTCRQQ